MYTTVIRTSSTNPVARLVNAATDTNTGINALIIYNV